MDKMSGIRPRELQLQMVPELRALDPATVSEVQQSATHASPARQGRSSAKERRLAFPSLLPAPEIRPVPFGGPGCR